MIDIRDLRDFPEFTQIVEHETSKEFSEFPKARPIVTLIALVDGKFAGAGSLSEGDLTYGPHSDKNPWIADLFVMEPYRGMGIARVLVARLVEIGPPEIYVWTKDRNLAMVYAKYADYLGNREYFENVIYVYVIRNPEVISL